MIRRLLVASAVAGLLVGGTASCIIVDKKPARAQKKASKGKKCKPSQYWDGNKCRHKGKGKGARKHDGR